MKHPNETAMKSLQADFDRAAAKVRDDALEDDLCFEGPTYAPLKRLSLNSDVTCPKASISIQFQYSNGLRGAMLTASSSSSGFVPAFGSQSRSGGGPRAKAKPKALSGSNR